MYINTRFFRHQAQQRLSVEISHIPVCLVIVHYIHVKIHRTHTPRLMHTWTTYINQLWTSPSHVLELFFPLSNNKACLEIPVTHVCSTCIFSCTNKCIGTLSVKEQHSYLFILCCFYCTISFLSCSLYCPSLGLCWCKRCSSVQATQEIWSVLRYCSIQGLWLLCVAIHTYHTNQQQKNSCY